MRIVKILSIRYGEGRAYAIADVELDDGSSASVFIGGDVETWFDPQHNKIKAHIKRNKA